MGQRSSKKATEEARKERMKTESDGRKLKTKLTRTASVMF
jgi:hypothetical protein